MTTQSEAFVSILNLLTVDELKPRFKACPGAGTAPARKAELVSAMQSWLSGSGLELLWQSLPALEQEAVRISLYCNDGWFDERRFNAEFGHLPAWFAERHYYEAPAEHYKLGCFFYPPGRYLSGQRIPDWLQQRLKPLVSPPPAVILPPQSLPDPLPGQVARVTREQAAARELRLMLTWLQEGRLRVSATTGLPGKALLKQLSKQLEEYYTSDSNEDAPGVEHIKAFGWIMILQASRWVECCSDRLVLTPAGQQQLATPLHLTIRALWQDWLDHGRIDEFSRIDMIRGQKNGRGASALTPVADRRYAIAAALTESPVAGWVSYPAFSRFVLMAGHEFEITDDVSTLYIDERHYGTLHYPQWEVLQGRYLRCLLLEYAATLGLVDLVLAPPQQPEPDYEYMWGAEDVVCLSRYDGLLYFRLTGLGAFCLGLHGDYRDESTHRQTPLAVHKGGKLVFSQPPTDAELLLVEAHARRDHDENWCLCREKLLTLLESGGSLAALRRFITERDPQPFLPHDVERLFAECEANAQAVAPVGPMLLLHCRDAVTAAAIAGHSETAGLCLAAGENRLLIKPERQAAFRLALHRAGFGMVTGD
ncbi:hypothetical protein LL240_03255 [Oceanimonas baumannii]|uniref:hypothetical protein n=1 Tax=Oceanimonas baumannii TaxID=129578 RepID=UPI001D186D98|nr:hypothetical protein [Oceanimonas baumannii]MCC4263474.1 hypothetical protein [Oceanimonas baumannii]